MTCLCDRLINLRVHSRLMGHRTDHAQWLCAPAIMLAPNYYRAQIVSTVFSPHLVVVRGFRSRFSKENFNKFVD